MQPRYCKIKALFWLCFFTNFLTYVVVVVVFVVAVVVIVFWRSNMAAWTLIAECSTARSLKMISSRSWRNGGTAERSEKKLNEHLPKNINRVEA